MREPLQLRDERAPETLVLVRLGKNTLSDVKLGESCEVTFAKWGLYGFSTCGLGRGGYEELGRLVPLLRNRQWVLEASAGALISDGFPVVPTAQTPHWTVVLSEPTSTQYERVRRHFSEPRRNPIWERGS